MGEGVGRGRDVALEEEEGELVGRDGAELEEGTDSLDAGPWPVAVAITVAVTVTFRIPPPPPPSNATTAQGTGEQTEEGQESLHGTRAVAGGAEVLGAG